MKKLRILSWGHRRATDPLRKAINAFSQLDDSVEFEIVERPLSDFEHQGIDGAAKAADLVIYDHPFSGDIAANNVFLPLEDMLIKHGFSDASRYVGPSLASYHLNGHTWGAPIDAAAQHAIFRQDLLEKLNETAPLNWQDTLLLGQRLRDSGYWLGMAVETPHALLTIASLMANAGKPWSTDHTSYLHIDRGAFLSSFALLRKLLTLCHPESMDWNSIDLHEAMVRRNDIAFCPCVFGYATYGEADIENRLSFGPFAGAHQPWHSGSVIGGTAAGISKYCNYPEDAANFAMFLLRGETQNKLIPDAHGQAATVESWLDEQNNINYNGYFKNVLSTMESAWIRPRHLDYLSFQKNGGEVVASMLRGDLDEDTGADTLISLANQVPVLPS